MPHTYLGARGSRLLIASAARANQIRKKLRPARHETDVCAETRGIIHGRLGP
jgi:hypothetical protein